MHKEAILHKQLSNYAHAIDETHIVFRLRAAKGDLASCMLYYGDRACRANPVTFDSVPMEVVAQDALYDYFEVVLDSPYTRICYYFDLDDGAERFLYYTDQFFTERALERFEYYQFPYNRREDIADIPDWAYDATIYNIFPDSFATGKRHITGKPTACPLDGQTVRGKLGGTILGIRENLDYIQDLGFNCIYINPIFAAGEYHKYDLLDYFRIDPCFGTNEDFKLLVEECHEKGIRVIIDGVFNHCSWHFFAFEDAVRNGEKSKYKDWFYGLAFPIVRPDNETDLPNYDCFAYERKMPKLNTSNPQVIEYFCRVCRYWIEGYDIDGWRLDVADEVDNHFWRAFRRAAKNAKPDCFIIGEVWAPAEGWLRGDQFDSTMNYSFRKNCRDFFALSRLSAAEFDSRVTAMRMRYHTNMTYGQLNLLDSHDVPRFLSHCGGDVDRLKLAVIFQMTFMGIPSVFYGDEQGLSGIEEDVYRQPMRWDGDAALCSFYRDALALRRNVILRRGGYETLHAEEDSGLYIFRRAQGERRATVILNASDTTVTVPMTCLADDQMAMGAGMDVRNGSVKPWGYGVFLK